MKRTGGLLGIKTSDGRIVEVLAFGKADERSTVFTTVADRQRRARFEFYFRAAGSARWVYLDALSLDRIRPAGAGEPDLEVHARCDGKGNLLLGMQGSGSAQPQVFVVEAKVLDRFRSLAGAAGPAVAEQPAAAARRPGAIPPAQGRGQRRGRKAAWIVLVPLLLGGLLLFYFLGLHGGPWKAEPARVSDAPSRPPGSQAAPKPQPAGQRPATPGFGSAGGAEAHPGGTGRAQEKDRAGTDSGSIPAGEAGQSPPETGQQPAAAAQVPAAAGQMPPPAAPEHPEAAPGAPAAAFGAHEIYEIIWGDTLWRITERYYGDRDLYPELAEQNDLLDPDYIVAGQSLRLPPAIGDSKRKISEEDRIE
jgi:hypothetical protein